MVAVSVSVKVGKHLHSFVPAVLACKPTGRLGEEEQADEEDKARHHLDTPGNAEGSGTLSRVIGTSVDVASTVLLTNCQWTFCCPEGKRGGHSQ